MPEARCASARYHQTHEKVIFWRPQVLYYTRSFKHIEALWFANVGNQVLQKFHF